jgi:hypothetical protein
MSTPAPTSKVLVLFVHAKDEAAREKLGNAIETGTLNRRRLKVLAAPSDAPTKGKFDFGVVLNSVMDETGMRDVLNREGLIKPETEMHHYTPARDDTALLEPRQQAASLAAE